MPKVTKNHINPNDIDFGFTALNSLTYPSMQTQQTDTIEWYDKFGNVATQVSVKRVIDFIDDHNLNDSEEKMHIEYLDEHFDEVTRLFYHMNFQGKEVGHAAA